MLVLGLTGNIGCGKSSLSNIFMRNKINVVDADLVSREIMNDKDTLDEIKKSFGNDIINEESNLNRKKLAQIVFNDDKELVKLNNITHPRIKEKINDKIKKIENNKENIVIVDGALLIEANYLDIIDKLIVIVCDEKVQIDRIIKRDNCSKEEAIIRIKSQMSQDEKMKYADYIIDNSADKLNLETKAEILIEYIKEKWCV